MNLASRRLLSLVAVIAAFLCGSSLGHAEDKGQAIERFDKGLINWTEGYVEASGSAAPNPKAPNAAAARLGAERAATAEGYRNLLEMVKGVRVDAETTVNTYVLISDVIRSRVEGIVKGARVIDRHYFSDGGVEVIVRMPLAGALTETMLEQVRPRVPGPGRAVPMFHPTGSSYEGVIKELQRQQKIEKQRAREAGEALKRFEEEQRRAAEAKKEAKEEERRAEMERKRKQLESEKERALLEAKRLDDLVLEASKEFDVVAPLEEPTPVPSAAEPAEGDEAEAEAGASTASSEPPEAEPSGEPFLPPAIITAVTTSASPIDPEQEKSWTGLIVDARGIGLRPSLLPKFLTPDGRVVYGAQSVALDKAAQQGLVGYARELEAAQRHLRVTDDPIVIKAVSAYGNTNSDVIVHAGDAEVIGKTASQSGYLEKARVMVVYN